MAIGQTGASYPCYYDNMRHIDDLKGGRQEKQPELQVEGRGWMQPKCGTLLHRPVLFHTTVPHAEMQRGTGKKVKKWKKEITEEKNVALINALSYQSPIHRNAKKKGTGVTHAQ